MQKFKITGINIRTGQVSGIEVEAESPEEARAMAVKRGLRHVAIIPAPRPVEPGPGDSDPHDAPGGRGDT